MENVHVKWEVNILYSTVYIIYSGVYSVHNTAYGVQSSVQSQQLHYRLFTIYIVQCTVNALGDSCNLHNVHFIPRSGWSDLFWRFPVRKDLIIEDNSMTNINHPQKYLPPEMTFLKNL